MSNPNPLDIRNLGGLLAALGQYGSSNYGFGPETNFNFPGIAGYGAAPAPGAGAPPGVPPGGIPPSNGATPGINGAVSLPMPMPVSGGLLGGLPPPLSTPSTGGGGTPPGFPVGGDTGNTVVTMPGTPAVPGTPATGGIDYGDVGQAAGLGGALLGPPGLLAGLLPIVNADPHVPGTPGTPAGADSTYMVGPDAPIGGDFIVGAAPGSALNTNTPTGGVPDANATLLQGPDGITDAGYAAAVQAVNATLATLPPEVAAQVVAAIQAGADPVDALNSVRIGGNVAGGWSVIGQNGVGGAGGFDSSADALDAIGQSSLVPGSGMGLLFGPHWRDHVGIRSGAQPIAQ